MDSIRYRRWRPPQSPLRIEFAAGLLDELKPDPASVETTGVLYGEQHGPNVRVESSIAASDHAAKPVGIYVARPRGEVFLTESNLELFEKHGLPVALVIAGATAGFFVRAADGAFESVRSYEEFAVFEEPNSQAPPPRPPGRGILPLLGAATGTALRTTWSSFQAIPAACLRAARSKAAWAGRATLTAALPLAALAYLHPRPAPPRPALQVREQAGQMRISWAPGQTGVLEIRDGRERAALPVFPDQSSLTYLRHSAEVEVSLMRVEPVKHGTSPGQAETSRFLGPPLPLAPDGRLRARIAQLRADAQALRAVNQRQRAQTKMLEKQIARLARDR